MIDTLAAVAAHGLEGAAGRFPDAPLPGDAFDGLLRGLSHHRLAGLAAWATADGQLPLTDGQFDALAELELRVQQQAVHAESSLLQVVSALGDYGIDSRVLKGAAFAHAFWPQPELRPFVDFDLLLHGEDMPAAVAACTELGAARSMPELRAGFDRRFGKGVTLIGPTGLEWDLHRTLTLGPFGFLVDLDDLWAGGAQFRLAGRHLSMPSPEACFLHACLHATVTGQQRLLSLRDVIEVSRAADVDLVREMASRWRATAAVRDAVVSAHDRLRLADSALLQWAGELQPTDDERRLFERYALVGFEPSRSALDAWRYVPGFRAKVAYARALAMPDRTNRRARGRTLRTQLRALRRRLR